MSERSCLAGAAGLAAPALGLAREGAGGALHGLYWLTAALAHERPLLLAVDDAQWGDLPSLGYLDYVGGRVADLPVCMVVVRDGEREREPLAMLAARTETEFLRPRELSEEACASLVRSVLGVGAADAFCAACREATGGNPFLLRELLADLERDRVDPSAERAAEVGRIMPETVSRSVLLRLARLSEDARELAGAVAVLGGDAGLAHAATLAGLNADRSASGR
ncbi:MAG: hypothetical protein ACRDK7_01710 [Solirubrobacteraceae bacterium]